MAKSKGSAFDEIITKFGNDDDKNSFLGLAEKYPDLKDYGMRQSDYSRRMDEVRDQVELATRWQGWEAENWDKDSGMTKTEKVLASELERLQSEKEDLERKVATGNFSGDEMTFEQLEQFGTDLIKKKGIVTSDDLAAKEAEFKKNLTESSNSNAYMNNAALIVPYLNQRHFNEFGELFDPNEFVKTAVEKQRFDLTDYYDKDFIVSKRQAKNDSDHKAEIALIKAEADKRIAEAKQEAEAVSERLKGMGSNGMGPSDDGTPSMGEFQRKYLGLDKTIDPKGEPPANQLGEGALAHFAAAKWRQDQLAGR